MTKIGEILCPVQTQPTDQPLRRHLRYCADTLEALHGPVSDFGTERLNVLHIIVSKRGPEAGAYLRRRSLRRSHSPRS